MLNRDKIKLIAVIAMTLNHIAHMFLTKGTFVYEILKDIGLMTAIIMCYFLVEGYRYTSSRKKYALRLFLFALVSQIPFYLAFKDEISIWQFNMIATLFLCFIMLTAAERFAPPVRGILMAACALLTVFCDWPLRAALFTYLFYRAGDDREAKKRVFFIGYVMAALVAFLEYVEMDFLIAAEYAALAVAGMYPAQLMILDHYDGTISARKSAYHKWFFYIYYPLHLLILYLIKNMI